MNRTANKTHGFTLAARPARRRGTILVATMSICFTLAAVVLVLTQKMAVESIASTNEAATIQADVIERGAEQYVLGLLTSAAASSTTGATDAYYSILDPLTYTDDYFAALQMGGQTQGQSDGWFWIVRPVYEGETDLPLFGLVDECSKLDINAPGGVTNDTGYNYLLMLPGMSEDQTIAASMVDWRDTNQEACQGMGAENTEYASMADPYYCKDAPYDTVEELLLVKGFTKAMLYGDGSVQQPLGMPSDGATIGAAPGGFGSQIPPRGLYDLLTVHAFSTPDPNNNPQQPSRGKININTAPSAVLYCIPGIQDGDVSAIVAYRSQNQINGGSIDINWVGASGIQSNITQYIVGQSYRYSADIVAVSHDGRAFKRVRIVIDTTATTVNPVTGETKTGPAIVSRHDMTDLGWPMAPEVLVSIRRGEGPPSEYGGSNNLVIGGTLR